MKHRPFILLVALVAVGLAIWRFGPGSIAPIPRSSDESPAAKRAPSVPEPTPALPDQPARSAASTPPTAANTIPNSPPPSSDAPPVAREQQPRPAVTGAPGSTAVSRMPPAVSTVPVPPVVPAATIPPDETKPATKFTPATAKAELEEVRMMFQEFRNSLGENPVGNNAEITKALLGDNVKQVRVTLPRGLRVNDDGEMCDPRGIPLFFHQLSGKEMEIRSAGADEKMWTDDDVVTK